MLVLCKLHTFEVYKYILTENVYKYAVYIRSELVLFQTSNMEHGVQGASPKTT